MKDLTNIEIIVHCIVYLTVEQKIIATKKIPTYTVITQSWYVLNVIINNVMIVEYNRRVIFER